jgi:hypothetical protein
MYPRLLYCAIIVSPDDAHDKVPSNKPQSWSDFVQATAINALLLVLVLLVLAVLTPASRSTVPHIKCTPCTARVSVETSEHAVIVWGQSRDSDRGSKQAGWEHTGAVRGERSGYAAGGCVLQCCIVAVAKTMQCMTVSPYT